MTPPLNPNDRASSVRTPGKGPAGTTIAEEQFRLLVDSVKDYAIFMLDPQGYVASWNAGARLIKGYQPGEILGRHMSVFYTAEGRAAQKPEHLLKAATNDGRVEDEGWRVRKDGSHFWADVVITALRDSANRLVGFAKVTRDLTERWQSEERLREAETRLSTTLHSIGDGVLAADERGRVTLINRVAQRLTGWPELDALGRPVEQVFHIVNEDTRARAPNPVARMLEEEAVVGFGGNTLLIARDGAERLISETGAPICGRDGAVRGAVLVFRDMTEERRAQEQLRQSEARLRLMIASISDYAIFMLDPRGNVLTWNAGAERIKGYAADEILGQHFSRFFVPDDVSAGKPEQELAAATRIGRYEDESWRVRKDGSRFWANVVISAVRDASGALVGFTKVTRDLTDRRHAEEERVRFAHAQEALRLRDGFLSIASHELKTPLTALQLQLQGLLDRRHDMDQRLAVKVEKAVRAGDRLSDLIESMLDVSRIATGSLSLDYDSFDLVQAARDVLRCMADAAHSAHCEVALTAAGPVYGSWDRLRVAQILTNLLSNAFKHACGTAITLGVRREGDSATIEIRDRGPGIAEDDLPRLFGRFERAGSLSQAGLGLGLYIASEAARAHGGSIKAENQAGGGTRFVVTLPLGRATEAV